MNWELKNRFAMETEKTFLITVGSYTVVIFAVSTSYLLIYFKYPKFFSNFVASQTPYSCCS
ncbi:hypothetical protein Scep_026451 [Stephania cephalantha]|uniref:Uncharacterized protein n=1 Tax=Stephania cephalantha TaxID=152367 RepID=A0AAP0EQG8_9MAGN